MRVVLVVEHIHHARQFMISCIGPEIAKVIAAGSADEAVMLVHMWEPNLVMIDESLPNQGAARLIGDLNSRPSSHPRIVLTTFEAQARRPELPAHVDAVIRKPINRERLAPVIALLLEERGKAATSIDTEEERFGVDPFSVDPSETLRQFG